MIDVVVKRKTNNSIKTKNRVNKRLNKSLVSRLDKSLGYNRSANQTSKNSLFVKNGYCYSTKIIKLVYPVNKNTSTYLLQRVKLVDKVSLKAMQKKKQLMGPALWKPVLVQKNYSELQKKELLNRFLRGKYLLSRIKKQAKAVSRERLSKNTKSVGKTVFKEIVPPNIKSVGKILSKAAPVQKKNLKAIPKGKVFFNTKGLIKKGIKSFNLFNKADQLRLKKYFKTLAKKKSLENKMILKDISQAFEKPTFYYKKARDSKMGSLFRNNKVDKKFFKILKIPSIRKKKVIKFKARQINLPQLNDFNYLLPLADLPYTLIFLYCAIRPNFLVIHIRLVF